MNVLIWSLEHNGWWKSGGWGYSPHREEAGIFSLENAVIICNQANIVQNATGEPPHEAIVPIPDSQYTAIKE